MLLNREPYHMYVYGLEDLETKSAEQKQSLRILLPFVLVSRRPSGGIIVKSTQYDNEIYVAPDGQMSEGDRPRKMEPLSIEALFNAPTICSECGRKIEGFSCPICDRRIL